MLLRKRRALVARPASNRRRRVVAFGRLAGWTLRDVRRGRGSGRESTRLSVPLRYYIHRERTTGFIRLLAIIPMLAKASASTSQAVLRRKYFGIPSILVASGS